MTGFLILTGTIVAVIALLTGVGIVFNLLLNPLKENQARIETELKEFKKEVTEKIEKILERLPPKKD